MYDSPEPIIKQTSQVLKEKGVENKIRSFFAYEICKAVLNCRKHIFIQILPHIKNRNTKAWRVSLAIVIKYLDEFKKNYTIDTIRAELQYRNCSISTDDNNITFKNLISTTRGRSGTLEEKAEELYKKVGKYIEKKEVLDEKPKIKSPDKNNDPLFNSDLFSIPTATTKIMVSEASNEFASTEEINTRTQDDEVVEDDEFQLDFSDGDSDPFIS